MKRGITLIVLLGVLSGMAHAANPQVTLQISGAASGTIVLEIYADQAPITAANFISYVKRGFYNGLLFHRVISGFMIQGGGYTTSLVRKTATYPAITNESNNGLSNLTGTIAMARTAYANSATSEFFINAANNTFLDYGSFTYDYYSGQPVAHIGYCVFGKVLSGMSLVNAIAALPTTTENGLSNVPVNDVIIQSATVTLNAPVCAEKLNGDLNSDCAVNLADFALMAQNWMMSNSILP